MNDRELLELAAKAARIERGPDRFDNGVIISLPCGRRQLLPQWNPLTDDGDALRLAVKLGMIVEPGMASISWWGRTFSEELLPCPYAAIRRAIVRAAADIGRQQ